MAGLAEAINVAESIGYVPVREDRLSLKMLVQPIVIRLAEPMTDDELIAFSRENKMFRVETNANGDLEIMSPVGYDGTWREMFAGAQLFQWAEAHGGVALGANLGVKLGGHQVRSPDAGWVSSERHDALTKEQRRGFLPFAPEFLIEVLSESDMKRALRAKMELWLSVGVQLAWMIDPFRAEVLVHRPGVPVEVLVRPGWVEADSVVTGFRLEAARMWAE